MLKLKIDNKKLLIIMTIRCISIKKLAEKSGVSRGTISAVKAGKSCSYLTIGKLAKALDIPVQELIEDCR